MGGNAFSEQLPAAIFPRMPPAFYNSLKARVIPRLEALYGLVAVPPEAPGKPNYGDLDISVCQPKNVKEGVPLSECVTLAEIERAVGSSYSIPQPGDRTSHFAVPVHQDEVHHFEINREAAKAGQKDPEQLYVQIDIHFCGSEENLRSRLLFQSYGELGMILGALAKTVGFTWSTSGLSLSRYKTYIPNPPSTRLTTSQPEIFEFFDLPLDVHARGFATNQEVFDWAAGSRFFEPHKLLPAMKAFRFKGERKMYQEFVDYLKSLIASAKPQKFLDVSAIQDEALSLFGKRKEFDDKVREMYLQCEVNKVFDGNMVKEWTGIPQKHWRDLKAITDAMRDRVLDGVDAADANWREQMIKLSVEERKALALKLKEELIPPKRGEGATAA